MRRKRLKAIEAELARAAETRRLYELLATKRHNDLLAAVAAVDKKVSALSTRIARDFKPTKVA